VITINATKTTATEHIHTAIFHTANHLTPTVAIWVQL